MRYAVNTVAHSTGQTSEDAVSVAVATRCGSIRSEGEVVFYFGVDPLLCTWSGSAARLA